MFMLVAGLPLALFWIWQGTSARGLQVEEIEQRHYEIANNSGFALEAYFQTLISTIESFSDSFVDGDVTVNDSIFKDLKIKQICVIDIDNRVVVRQIMANQFDCLTQIPSGDYSLLLQLAEERIPVSNVQITEGNDPHFFIIKLVKDKMVVGVVHTTFAQKLREQIDSGKSGYATILDNRGRVVAHARDDWVKSTYDMSGYSIAQKMLQGYSGVETFNSPESGVKTITGFRSISPSGWGVMVSRPIDEIGKSINFFNQTTIQVLLVGLLLSGIIAMATVGYFTRSFSQIKSSIQRLSTNPSEVQSFKDDRFLKLEELIDIEADVNRTAKELLVRQREELQRSNDYEHINESLRAEISSRREILSELEQSKERFRSLFENQPISVREEDYSEVKKSIDLLQIPTEEEFEDYLLQNPEFIIKTASKLIVVDVNQKGLELHGYTDKQKFITEMTQHFSDDSIHILKKIFGVVYRGGTTAEFEANFFNKNNKQTTVISRWSVIAGHEQKYDRIILTSINVTDYRQTLERLSYIQKNEVIGQLSGGVAHDFNNLLAVIRGNADLLTMENKGSQELIDQITSAVSSGAELTQRLLAFSRYQSLSPQAIDIEVLVSGMLDMLRRTLGATIELETIVAPNLECAFADPGEVENALLNLVINARDAMPDGGRLIIECRNSIKEGENAKENWNENYREFVEIAVSDDGEGMSADVLANVFEPFFTTKEVGKGSGLGLSVVHGFAEQSGGYVDINSDVGVGTTVSLYLPRCKRGDRTIREKNINKEFPVGQGEIVLVVEDNKAVRNTIVKMLVELNYSPIPTSDASEAWKIFSAQQDVDIVLTDVVLPGGVSGPEFVNQLKENNINVKVVFMSGFSAMSSSNKKEIVPGESFLRKPFDRDQLATALARNI